MTCCNSIPIVWLLRVPARHAPARLLHQLPPPAMPAPLTPSSALPASGPSKRHGDCPKTSTSRRQQPTASTTPEAHFKRLYRNCHTEPRPSHSRPTAVTVEH